MAEANGQLEVVDSLVRRITFELYSAYFGIPDPPGGDLRVWATRLFEFQFVDMGNDPALRSEVDVMAPALRDHIQSLIETRRSSGQTKDDVLGRCLAMQAANTPGFDDDQIRSSLMGFIVGGPPQPPMVVPQALEQLLRRPDALAGAQEGGARRRRQIACRICLRSDALRSARAGAASGRHRSDCTIADGNVSGHRRARRRQRLRRVQLGHDGRAPGARLRKRSTRGGCRTNTSISATGCISVSAST